MPKTTNSLISDAFQASGVISKDFDTPTASQISDGLEWLNEILTEKDVDKGMIPHSTTFSLNCVAGQEQYFVPGCLKIDTITFFKNNIRYALEYKKRNAYKGSSRVEDISTLPDSWFFESAFGGCNLYLFFLPDQDYPLEITGIFSLAEVSLAQDLQLTVDKFFITFLKYALVDRICSNYNMPVPPGPAKHLMKLESLINKHSNTIDLQMKKYSTLNSGSLYSDWDILRLYSGSVNP